MSITDKVQNAIKKGFYSCGLFLDLSKAFDTVDYTILLQKLEHHCIRGTTYNWFKSYLTNRTKFVSIGNTLSDTKQVLMGAPKGSVLGPLLFLLSINDFSNSSRAFEFHLFADDSTLFYSDNSSVDLENKINIELASIYDWLSANQLSLNIDKSNFVIFHPPQKKIMYQVKLLLKGNYIKQEHSIKYLGVMIDENLNWKSHVSLIECKIKRAIGMLSKLRHFVTRSILVSLYYSLIYPYLTYGIVIWGNTYPHTTKKAIRTVADFKEYTNPIFIDLRMFKFHDIVWFQSAIFMHDFHHSNLPVVFNQFFLLVNKRHGYNTRSVSKLNYSLPHTNQLWKIQY